MGYVSLSKKMEYEQTPTEHATATVCYITVTIHVRTVWSIKFTRYILHNPLSVLVRPEPHNHR